LKTTDKLTNVHYAAGIEGRISMTFPIRDPVHNFVNLRDELLPVVNTAALQRLRGIGQQTLFTLVPCTHGLITLWAPPMSPG
jgi:hypothetical protein